MTSETKEAGIALPLIRRRPPIIKKFARKTIRTGDATIEDISREVRVVSWLKEGDWRDKLTIIPFI